MNYCEEQERAEDDIGERRNFGKAREISQRRSEILQVGADDGGDRSHRGESWIVRFDGRVCKRRLVTFCYTGAVMLLGVTGIGAEPGGSA